ncbi:hypothetical protein C4J97_2563 [Pseudomonas orientalis]|nr:hypothetical protein C4J97_2563 [Pseudomonas orientalis]
MAVALILHRFAQRNHREMSVPRLTIVNILIITVNTLTIFGAVPWLCQEKA